MPGGPDAGTNFPAAPGPGGDRPGPGAPGPGPDGVPAPGGLRGTVNLTMPLSAWLGWTQAPGDVPGYGPVDAEDSRALARLLARPGNQWCVTLTDPAGHPVAHACARHGPGDEPGQPGVAPGTKPVPAPTDRAGPPPRTAPRTEPGPPPRTRAHPARPVRHPHTPGHPPLAHPRGPTTAAPPPRSRTGCAA